MLLYVSTGDPRDREPRPLHTIPDTVPRLYDLGMREHDRASVVTFAEGGEWVETPDWRFDREVIRIALYCRERLHLMPDERVAIFGPAHRLGLAADFASQGLAATVVGVSHLLEDDDAAAALAESRARIVFATDEASAHRLLSLHARMPALAHLIAPLAAGAAPLLPWAQLMALADTLDTAERAQQFRATARAVPPEHEALWHYEPGGAVGRLTQREAMEQVRARLVAQPARPGDLAYLEGAFVSAETRFAAYAFVGDGHSTIVLGRPEGASGELPALRPARVLARASWVEELRASVEATPAESWERWADRRPGLGWLHRRRRRGRLRAAAGARLGDRLRSLEAVGPLSDATRSLLLESGVPLRDPAPRPPVGEPRLRPATGGA